MINVDLKINCNCQLVATDTTNYCNIGYDINDVIVVEGVTGLGYQISNLNNACGQTFSRMRSIDSDDWTTVNRLANRILYPCGTTEDSELFGTFDYINSLFNAILDPCGTIYPDYPDYPDDPDYPDVPDNPDDGCTCIDEPISIWDLPKDGYYKYYKILVYKSPLKGQIYWDGITLRNGNDILNLSDLDSYLVNPTIANSLGILKYCKPIELFSICQLKKCVTEMQQKYIQNQLLWCTKTYCKQYDDEEFKFLFITVNLLEKLIECKKFSKAEKILESISTCTSVCSNLEYNKKCNCNG